MHKCTLFVPLFDIKSCMHDTIVRRNVFDVEFVVKYSCYTVHKIKFRENANFDENENVND